MNALPYSTANPKKSQTLLDLPGARERLTIWKADLDVEGSFDEAIEGCNGVFHVATPMDFESKDPENEVIKPTVKGLLSIMKSCKKTGTVKRVIFTSSAGTVNVQEHQQSEYDESSWSDIEFCRRVQMTGWVYFQVWPCISCIIYIFPAIPKICILDLSNTSKFLACFIFLPP